MRSKQLASLVRGNLERSRNHFLLASIGIVVGIATFTFFIALALNSDFVGLQAQDLNLVTAVLVAFALLVPAYKRRLAKLLPGSKPKASAVATPKEA